MKTVLLWIYAGILTCCLVFLLVLVSNESELAKFQNGVSNFMQDKQVSASATQDGNPPPTYGAISEKKEIKQSNVTSKKNENSTHQSLVISLTSVDMNISQFLLNDFTSQGGSDKGQR